MKHLTRLRIIFVIYFILKIKVDLGAGSHITSRGTSYFSLSPETYYKLAIGLNIFLFLIGLSLFYFLLEKRNWARIILLIIGWLAVFDFFSSLLISSKAAELLTHIDRSTDWNAIILIDQITDFFGFVFWGYAIFILQFNTNVKKIFLPESKNKELA